VTTLACAMLGALCLAGCASAPDLALHSAQATRGDVAGATIEVTFSIRNDNAFSVRVRHVRADLVMGRGHRIPPADASPNISLGSQTQSLVGVRVVVPCDTASALLAESGGAPRIPFRVSGFADVIAAGVVGMEVGDYRLDEHGTIARAALTASCFQASAR
jgi:hypothetical protein